MKVSVPRMTIEELHRLPEDGNRYELIGGELHVSAAPREKHQRVSMELAGPMHVHAKLRGLGRVYHAALDVFLDPSSPTCVEPDIVFVAQGRLHLVDDEGVHGAPDLVVEILSETTRRTDLTTKLDLYRRAGVQEYWIGDSYQSYILVYRFAESSEPQKLVPGDILTTPLLPGLEIAGTALFAE